MPGKVNSYVIFSYFELAKLVNSIRLRGAVEMRQEIIIAATVPS
jgi:hypothetical protein